MKLSISIIGFTLTVALVASGGIVGTNSTAVLATAPAETPALAGVAPVQSEGEQLLQARCAVCHDLGGVAEFQAAYDENSLRELVATMISYGAQVNDAETDILVAYLLGNKQADTAPAFDEAAAANLVNASCTTCHDLTGIERGLYPADEWRETVNRMLGHGLNISNEEIETIVTYLGSAPAAQDDEVAVAQDDEAPAFDEAAAANLVNASCTTCHDLTGIERGLYPADEWRETVNRMLGHGLNISNEEIETIVTYLGSAPAAQDDEVAVAQDDEAPAFDEAAAANLVNASCTTCHDLTGIERGLYPADEWRETVNRMLGHGLNISNEEIETIVTYLGSAPAAQDDEVAVAQDDEAPAFDEAAAANLVNASCTTCHDLTGIERGLYPADEWRETVNRMLGHGLNISNEEIETIVTYLGSAPAAQDDEVAVAQDDEAPAFDEAAAANLVNASCTTCHDLTGIERGLYPADEWRETVNRMLGHGLNISNEEIETIVTYLGSAPAAQDDEVAVAQDDEAPAFDEAAAANLVNASCTTCHDLTGIERGLYPADEWRETVSRMLGYGLNISDEEFETIVTYLGTSPDTAEADAAEADAAPAFDETAAASLVNASCTTCHDLTGIERGLYPADEWRETVSRMMGYGLNISNEEFETIVTYLGTAPDAVEAVDRDVDDDGYDAAAAEMLLNSACTTCHDLTGITSAPGTFTEADFRETIERMLGHGAAVSNDEIDILVRYLTETYGVQ